MENIDRTKHPPVARDPAPPEPGTPVGEPSTPEIPPTERKEWVDDDKNSGQPPQERPGKDWGRGEDANPQPPNFPGGNDPKEPQPEPGTPGIDPNPSNPGEPGPGREPTPEGPQPPNRYPNPSEPQEPFDRPPVKPQGASAQLHGTMPYLPQSEAPPYLPHAQPGD